MGREIRMVPPNWEHPRYTEENAPFDNRIGEYHPLFDEDFEKQANEWFADCLLWSRGEHPDQQKDYCKEYKFYWQWAGNPPDAEYYRPKWADEEMIWFQVYETVSEGTPVTPPFATKAELVDYLSTKGDFWDQKRGEGAWDRDAAEKFVGHGWAPSLIVTGGQVKKVSDAGFY